MIDDLVLQGVTEPYRMLTARAEYRLSLRADNAETRLGELASAAGCLSEQRLWHQRRQRSERATLRSRLNGALSASIVAEAGAGVSRDGAVRSAFEWLRFEGVTLAIVAPDAATDISPAVVDELLQDAVYAPYVDRQDAEIVQLRTDEEILIDPAIDYANVAGLSNEMIDRLCAARPASMAEASRIRGVTPAALSAILLHSRRRAA